VVRSRSDVCWQPEITLSNRPLKPIAPDPQTRIQQHVKPKLNQTERDALAWLKAGNAPGYDLRPHAIRLELANGCLYTPDIIGVNISFPTLRLRAWEVKGKHAWDDSIVKLKVAAREWPQIWFALIWRDEKHSPWLEQEVLP
jgi:hypothetical protein